MKSFANVNPRSLDEAVASLSRARGSGKLAVLAAGGDSVVTLVAVEHVGGRIERRVGRAA